MRSLRSGKFLDRKALDVFGSVGGILICWDKRSLKLLDWEEGQFSLSCRLRNVENGVVWVFTGVYGPFTREEMECLWEEIGAIGGIWEEPWCLGGDFNIILSQSEKKQARENNLGYEEVCSGCRRAKPRGLTVARGIFHLEWGP